jgi:hypothetical protein
MDITPMPNGSFYIQIPKSEIPPDDDYALLLKTLLPEHVETSSFSIFPGESGALVFARAREGAPVYASFPNIERVIDAAERCEPGTTSFLAYMDDKYILILYPTCRNDTCHANNGCDGATCDDALLPLYDYATPERLHPDYTRHIAEHGRILLGPNAIEDLQAYFGERT